MVGVPAWELASLLKKGKKEPDPQVWLDVAEKCPGENVSRAPKLPKREVQRQDEGPEPDDTP